MFGGRRGVGGVGVFLPRLDGGGVFAFDRSDDVAAAANFSVKVIGKKSPGFCSVKAGAIIGKASGPCKVRVSVTSKGVTTSKNVVLRTVR